MDRQIGFLGQLGFWKTVTMGRLVSFHWILEHSPFLSHHPSVLQHACHCPHTLFTLRICVCSEKDCHIQFSISIRIWVGMERTVCARVCVLLSVTDLAGLRASGCVLRARHISTVTCSEWMVDKCVCVPFKVLQPLISLCSSTSCPHSLQWPQQISRLAFQPYTGVCVG